MSGPLKGSRIGGFSEMAPLRGTRGVRESKQWSGGSGGLVVGIE